MTALPSPTMTPERWRTVDQILQGALVCSPGHRDEFVAESCGDDAALRAEVSSLLAAYDKTPLEFLERPAIEEHRAASAEPPAPSAAPARPKRSVSARVLVYATAAGIVLGIAAGWNLAQSPTVGRWRGTLRAIQQQADANGNASANPASSDAPAAPVGELSLFVVDRKGRLVREISANRPSAPRFSLDGRRIAYGALGEGRSTSDVWITDLDGATRRLTNDDADNNHPQWSPNGGTIAYSTTAQGGKRIAEQPASGGGVRIVASPPGTQFPTDWMRDGSALLVSVDEGDNREDIAVQPTNGSAGWRYSATRAQETVGRISPHTHWVAFTSNESGRDEVYVDSYPRSGYRLRISQGGGTDPVWRADGGELYYWRGESLMAVPIDGSRAGRPPILGDERVLFQSAHEHSLHSMYDVSPDGNRFVIVRRR